MSVFQNWSYPRWLHLRFKSLPSTLYTYLCQKDMAKPSALSVQNRPTSKRVSNHTPPTYHHVYTLF